MRRWKQLEPGTSRIAMPVTVVQAVIALALLWGWPSIATAIWLMFAGMLQPREMLVALREDLLLPADVGHTMTDAFLHIRSPKTRRVVRQQHARFSDAGA
eukprot:3842604-Amphidinium_carterae.1